MPEVAEPVSGRSDFGMKRMLLPLHLSRFHTPHATEPSSFRALRLPVRLGSRAALGFGSRSLTSIRVISESIISPLLASISPSVKWGGKKRFYLQVGGGRLVRGLPWKCAAVQGDRPCTCRWRLLPSETSVSLHRAPGGLEASPRQVWPPSDEGGCWRMSAPASSSSRGQH